MYLRFFLPIVFAALLFALLGTSQEAYGADLGINDSVEAEITFAHDANWERGVNSAGTIFGDKVPGSTTTAGETATFSGTYLVNSGGTPDPGEGIIFFTDSDGQVSDTVTASWSTEVNPGFDVSTITITVQSSPNCEDLGPLPAGFTGIPEPLSSIAIQGSFLDPTTGNPVTIPSNLTIQFTASEDIGCEPRVVSNFYWSEDDGTGEIFTADAATKTITQLTSQPGVLFGTDARNGLLLSINQNTGVGTIVGPIGIRTPSLAIDPTTGIMYAGGGGGNSNIFTVNTATGQAIFVGFSGLGVLTAIGGMDFRSDGTLFAAVNIAGAGGTGSDHLATINTSTGAATIIGPFGTCFGVPILFGFCTIDGIEGIAFDPAGNLLGVMTQRGSAGPPGLYSINTSTGAATFLVPLLDGAGAPASGGFTSLQFDCDGTLYGGTATGFGAADGGFLATINPANGQFSFVGPASATVGSNLGGLAVSCQSFGGFARIDDVEIDPLAGKLWWNNWAPGPLNAGPSEDIYNSNLDGTGQVSLGLSSSCGGPPSGLTGIVLDPANQRLFYTRGVSYDNCPNGEVSRVNMDGTGQIQLDSRGGDSWHPDGIELSGNTVFWGDPGILIRPAFGPLNTMNTAGLSKVIAQLPHVNGEGRSLSVDDTKNLLFYSSHGAGELGNCGGGPNSCRPTGGGIFVVDLSNVAGGATAVLTDPSTGIPDIELDIVNQRIYWTDYARGEIRSATYDAFGNLSNITTELSGLTNPYGLALEFTELEPEPEPEQSNGGGPQEAPTIGKNMAGDQQMVTNGICIDAQCWTVTQDFHVDFELVEMLTSPHTISNTIYCANGVDKCNHITLSAGPYQEDINAALWKVSLDKSFQGELTMTVDDPDDYLGETTCTAQIIEEKYWGTSCTIDFKKPMPGMMLGVQVWDSYKGVRNFYFNDGIEIIDTFGYPSVDTEFESSIDVPRLCLSDNPDKRTSCAFAEKMQLEIERAERLLAE